jgi:hypothetical protein
MATVLKTVRGLALLVGSNPTPSALTRPNAADADCWMTPRVGVGARDVTSHPGPARRGSAASSGYRPCCCRPSIARGCQQPSRSVTGKPHPKRPVGANATGPARPTEGSPLCQRPVSAAGRVRRRLVDVNVAPLGVRSPPEMTTPRSSAARSSAGARRRPGRTSSGLAALRGSHLDPGCAPAHPGSCEGTDHHEHQTQHQQVSTLSGGNPGASG